MAKKAKIDLLDVDIGEENKEILPEDTRGDPVPDKQADKTGNPIHALTRLLQFRKNLIIILVPVLLIVAAGGSIWFYYAGKKKESVSREKDALKTAIPPTDQMVLFEKFVVNARDKKGDVRIVFCDIAVELENPQIAGAVRERVDIRNVIYAVLKSKQIADGLSPEGRNIIKNALKDELNRLLDGNSVKNIYISRFEVI